MNTIQKLAIGNAACFGAHLAVSSLTQTRAINNNNVGEISAKYPSLFTPSGNTFLIWAVIYCALIAFSIYHLVAAYRRDSSHEANRDIEKIGLLFMINNLCTAAWLIVWVNEKIAVSVGLIIIQLITLIMIHNRLCIHDAARSMSSKVFTQFPLSIYLGWISIATIANISSFLTAAGWTGWDVSAINWTITMIAIAVLLTLGVINRRKNVFFGLVVLWALYGIRAKTIALNGEGSEPINMVIIAGMVVIAAACGFGLIRNLRRR